MSEIEFESLVTQYSRDVLTTALRVLGNASLAGDVHQEVFLAIWRRWHKYDGKTNWRPYLYRATVRKAIELAKRKWPEPLAEHIEYSPFDLIGCRPHEATLKGQETPALKASAADPHLIK